MLLPAMTFANDYGDPNQCVSLLAGEKFQYENGIVKNVNEIYRDDQDEWDIVMNGYGEWNEDRTEFTPFYEKKGPNLDTGDFIQFWMKLRCTLGSGFH